MSQHNYDPAGTDDPATTSYALLWMNAQPETDPEVQALREQLDQQYRDAGIEEAE